MSTLNDPRRLELLAATGLLDAPPSALLDRLTRVATRLLGVPVALVSLVDDRRQWFAGLTGLGGWAGEQRQTPLTHSFCQHVVTAGAPLVIYDTAADARAAGNGAVADLEVRAYAGVPITTTDGHTLGAFCAIDGAPRAWTSDEVETLRDLAAAAVAKLELRIAGRALREQSAQYRAVLRHYPDGAVFLFDHELRYLIADGTALHASGFDPVSFTGRRLGEVLPPELAATVEPHYRAALAGEERQFVTSSGGRLYESSVVPVRGESHAVTAGLLISRDVTERAHAAEALRASEARLAGIIESASDAVISIDAGQRVVVFNRAAEAIFGVPAAEAIGSPLERFIPARHRAGHADEVERFGATGSTTRSMGHPGVLVGLRADGSEFPIEATISHTATPRPDGTEERLYTVILRDVAQRERLAAELRQAQKLEAVGRLAGGIAHDFNNLLTGIRGSAELALADMRAASAPAQPCADVEEILHTVDRAAALTRQLLAFSRQQVLHPRAIEPDEVVASMDKLLRRVIGSDVALRLELGAYPHRVLMDPSQLEQVLVNLVVNARDAMPDGGTVVTRTYVAPLHALPVTAVRPAFAEREHALVVSVRDTGSGMPPEVLQRVFEPFFTTKPEGKGSGLGLATVHGIAEQSGGSAWIESTPGQGTTVSIALPLAPPSDGQGAAVLGGATASPGRGLVLLVEDDQSLRTLATRFLERGGYQVVAARHGREAIARWEEWRDRHDAFVAVVSDLVMPERGGRSLVAHLRAGRPSLPVLFVSGYAEGGMTATDLGERTAFLPKPFSAEQLHAALHALLGQERR